MAKLRHIAMVVEDIEKTAQFYEKSFEMKRVFGTDGNLGEQLGLTKDWVARIVKAVGNYGEAFDRNVGAGSKLGIARGLNGLWNKGGLQYAPPIR